MAGQRQRTVVITGGGTGIGRGVAAAFVEDGARAVLIGRREEPLREAADLVLDAGELPGTPSTVIDLRAYETQRTWKVLRAGALRLQDVERALD